MFGVTNLTDISAITKILTSVMMRSLSCDVLVFVGCCNDNADEYAPLKVLTQI